MQRSYTDGAVTTIESFLYSYLTSGENTGNIESVTLRRNVNGVGWHEIRRASYTYYTSSSDFGSSDDLETAVQQMPDGSGGWIDLETNYYRYYLDSAGGLGFAHGLRFVLEPEAFRRLSLVTDPLTATDTEVAAYADYYFEYDDEQRVVLETVEAGTRTFQFSYTASGNLEGYNSWQQKTIETLPDGSQNTVYSNHLGQILLKQFSNGSDSWTEYHQYDAHDMEILVASPSAVQGYDDTRPDLGGPGTIVKPSAGLVTLTDYYATTTATASTPGGAARYPNHTKVQEGLLGAPIRLTKTTYFQRRSTDDDPTTPVVTLFPKAEEIVYQDEASGGSRPSRTGYAYTWFVGTVQMKQSTITFPEIPTSQNGSGIASERRMMYDRLGNMTWEQGPRDFVDQFVYDVVLGVAVRHLEDVNPPSGFGWPSPPSGTRLNLQTDYEYDDLGRVTQILGPAHPINGTSVRTATWNVYQDALHQVWTAQGSATGPSTAYVYTLVNPVTLTFLDHANRITDTISAVRSSTAGRLSDSDSFPQSTWVAWSSTMYDDAGLKIASRAYHTIPASGTGTSGTDYDETDYAYDVMDRLLRVQTPGGTLTRNVYEPRGLVIGIYVGTNDAGATPSDPTGGGTSGNNMVQTTGQVYDNGAAGGDGNLTQQTNYVDGSGTLDRVTDYSYDFRNRQTVIDGEIDLYQQTTYDNVNRIIQVDRYDTNAGGHLLARTLTAWDNQGRVYRTQRYAVDPSTGTLGHSLIDNTWYDEAGNVIKQLPAGSKLFTKSSYDSQARLTATYLGYYTAAGQESYSDVGQITSSNKIFEQTLNTYDDAGNQVLATTYQRFDTATGNGVLQFPYASQPLARASYIAQWFDVVSRVTATADYGTNGDAAFTRPATAPASSDTVLVTTYGYDDAGNQDQTTDPAGKVTRRTFNALHKVVSMIDNYVTGYPGNSTDVTVRFGYNGDGNLVTLTAVNPTTGDQVTTYVYGTTLSDSAIASNDLLRATIYPDSSGGSDQVTQSYNRQKQVTGQTDQRGTVHAFLFDKLGRLNDDAITTLGTGVDGAVRRISRSYEVRGLVAQITSSDASSGGSVVNQVQNAYNDFWQLSTQYQATTGAVSTGTTPNVQYNYADGSANTVRLISLTYPNGRVIALNYAAGDDDALGRISAIVEASGGATLVGYTYLGVATFVKTNAPQPDLTWNLITGSGANPYASLDRFGRVINCQWTNASGNVEQVQYDYNRASSRTTRHETLHTGNDELYTYDGLQRLVDMSRGDLATGHGTIDNMSIAQQWTLDATGNWSQLVNTDVGTPANNLDQQRTSNTVNEITAVMRLYGAAWITPAYDPAGNMTTIPSGNDPTVALTGTYDAWNRLVALAGTASYRYDGTNRRVTTTISGTTRRFYYSNRWQAIEERLGSSSTPDRHFVWGLRYIDDLVLRDRSTTGTLNERLYAVQDANWNVTSVTDTSAAVQERYRYSAYGEPTFLDATLAPITAGGSFEWEALYCGYRWDTESGLYQVRFRNLQPCLGMWCTFDPLGVSNNEVNLLRYVSNATLTLVDPFGLQPRPGERFMQGIKQVPGKIVEGIKQTPEKIKEARQKFDEWRRREKEKRKARFKAGGVNSQMQRVRSGNCC